MEQFVTFDKRAWHAGISDWRGRSGCNDFSIGVELEGSVVEDYTAPQYRTLIQLVIALMGAYPRISTDALVGHCEIAPGRKADPGPKFDWPRVVGQVYQHLGA
jgi:AmpD protein